MNNYNFSERTLHKLALSNKLIREATFDLENLLYTPHAANNSHVFVIGLARSGSTALLNAIFASDEFASLTYSDMPFLLAPNLWKKANVRRTIFDEVERAHGDGIKISNNSPEAFEEVFWTTFDNSSDTIEKFKIYIGLILRKYDKHRYLSKNNQNIKRIELVKKILPDAKLLIPFRNPLQHSYSLYNQHNRFLELGRKDRFISKYMKLIGHTEFGTDYNPIIQQGLAYSDPNDLNHWLEQWVRVYSCCVTELSSSTNIKFISHETLCTDVSYWKDILDFIDIEKEYDFSFTYAPKEIDGKFDLELSRRSFEIYDQLMLLQR